MREIKFRGKCDDNGEWVYGDLEYNRLSWVTRIHTYRDGGRYQEQRKVDPSTVGQFTGLLDKNGAEIYEGDILLEEPTELEYEVCWFDSLSSFMADMIGDIKPFRLDELEPGEYCKIIGNIHDNPAK